MWINGMTARPVERERLTVTNPATEEEIGFVVRGTAADAEAAATAAAAQFDVWKRVSPGERTAALRAIADKLAARKAVFADLLTAEQGKPRRDNEAEIDATVENFQYYAGFSWHDRGVVNPAQSDFLDFVVREPVGPVAAIVPWNFPIMLMARKVAPALAAGNTVVVKPSEETPLSAVLFAETVADHLPPGVFNVVTGYGPEVAEPLVTDPRIRHIAFTGSTATGQRIARLVAGGMKRVTLELGGKDPLIVGPDVDLPTVVPAVAFAALLNAGQCCTSTERIYVAECVRPAFIDALVDHVRGIRVGDGADDRTDMGPLVRRAARDKVAGHVDQAIAAGAKVLTGGGPPSSLTRGWFYEPTVVVDVPPSAALLRDETFGPVLPVAGFGSVDEAIRMANDTVYGLGASVLSDDPEFVKRCLDGLEVGNVFVNDPLTAGTASPFGGTKMSGIGRELGVEGFEQYRESKHVHWKLGRPGRTG